MNQSQIFHFHPKSSSNIEYYSLLLLSNVDSNDSSARLCFSRFIYLHVDIEWNYLGISISESIRHENPDFCELFQTGSNMYKILLAYKDEIAMFCELYCTEFQKIFDLCPTDYFEFSSVLWAEHANVLS
jgi:hypothetical protein